MESWPDRVIRWLLPTLGGLLVVAAYAFTLFLRAGSLFAGDGDPGRHIRVGSYILESRSIPRADLFSHTMQGKQFIPFEWLSEVFFAGAHEIAGLAGVAVLTAILFAGAVGLVYLAVLRAGVPPALAFGFGFASLVLQAIHLHPRPHMFTTLLVAAFSLVLLDARRDRSTRRLLILPLLMLAWANLHGGYLLGFILLAVFAIDAAWTRRSDVSREAAAYARWIMVTLGLCLVASFLTPAGWDLWPHTVGYLRETWLVNFTQEYASPDFHNLLVKFFLVTLMVGTAVFALLRTRVDYLGLATWILFAAFALHSVRNVPIFSVVVMPWLAAWTVQILEQDPESSSLGGRVLPWARRLARTESTLPGWPIALLTLVTLTVVALQPARRDVYRFDGKVFPVAAMDELTRSGFDPPGPVYNEFRWGGYLLYRAWPAVPVFIDGQTDFYGEELTREYLRIRMLEPDWDVLLRKHGVEWALIPPAVPLAQALRLRADWRIVYSDSTAVAFVHDEERAPPRVEP